MVFPTLSDMSTVLPFAETATTVPFTATVVTALVLRFTTIRPALDPR